jgi:hypothetical protein
MKFTRNVRPDKGMFEGLELIPTGDIILICPTTKEIVRNSIRLCNMYKMTIALTIKFSSSEYGNKDGQSRARSFPTILSNSTYERNE